MGGTRCGLISHLRGTMLPGRLCPGVPRREPTGREKAGSSALRAFGMTKERVSQGYCNYSTVLVFTNGTTDDWCSPTRANGVRESRFLCAARFRNDKRGECLRGTVTTLPYWSSPTDDWCSPTRADKARESRFLSAARIGMTKERAFPMTKERVFRGREYRLSRLLRRYSTVLVFTDNG
jgi:hypothetical protein